MRRISTFSLALVIAMAATTAVSAQCPTGTFVTASSNTFDANTEGFTGDFTWSNGAGGRLQSSNVGAGTTKVLTSSSYLVPNNATQIGFGFNLAGTANVTGYTVEARYVENGTIQTVALCSGGALAAGTYSFLATAPAEIIGERIQLRVTFTVAGGNGNNITIDNFITNIGASEIILPVHFSSFDARTAMNSVKLSWGVDVEENVQFYEVQRGTDGKGFTSIGSVDAAATSHYSFTDGSPLSGASFYRIKAVDFDGKYMYSTIVSLKGGKSSVILRAFPLPAAGEITVQHGAAARGASLTLSTQDGKIVKTIAVAQGTLQTKIDLSALQTGMYLVQFSSENGEVETLKIVKQ